jgi:hypothetical protein
MDIYKWLKVGIALFLVFQNPRMEVLPDRITVSLELENLLTDEMQELLDHGVEFEYQLYCSLKALGAEKGIKIKRVTRKIYYDYLEDRYYLSQESKIIWNGHKRDELLEKARHYPGIVFYLETKHYRKFSLFAQVRLLENPILKKQLHLQTRDFWLGYTPAVEYMLENPLFAGEEND